MNTNNEQAPTIRDQAPLLLNQAAGYVGHRMIGIGLRNGLIETLAENPDGLIPEELAEQTGCDPFYVKVWCRSALATQVCRRSGEIYQLAPHMKTLLLDQNSPAYVGGIFQGFEQEEVFDNFEQVLESGEHTWWDECSPEWISSVAATSAPFYLRFIPGGLSQVPGLTDRLESGGRIVDTSCGTGEGLVRLAEHYSNCEIVGVDGDEFSTELAAKRVNEAGFSDRVSLRVSPLEEMSLDEPATLVINNVSMHECRDIDRVTQNIREALEPGGWFVISDFPFPDSVEGLSSVPGRIMAGIQFFEAQIDAQLLPRSAYDELLTKHEFTDLGNAELAPVHALTWGRRPQ